MPRCKERNGTENFVRTASLNRVDDRPERSNFTLECGLEDDVLWRCEVKMEKFIVNADGTLFDFPPMVIFLIFYLKLSIKNKISGSLRF